MTPREAASTVISNLRARGFEAYAIGGCVRDLLLNREPKDYDVVTNAKPENVEALFADTKAVGKQFGIIIVGIEDQQIEVATYRSDGDYSDGRRPDTVIFAETLRDDISRRDFTINGLVSDLQGPGHGFMEDPLGEGVFLKDLNDRVICAIGNPDQRFAEDKLRMLRAIRFAVQLGFTIAPATFKAIKAHADEIEVVSRERVRDELFKILMSPEPARGIFLMNQTGLLARLLPCVHEGEQFGRVLSVLETAVNSEFRTPELMLAILLLWCDDELSKRLDTTNRGAAIESLRLSAKQVAFLEGVDRWFELFWIAHKSLSETKRFLRQPYTREMIALHSLIASDFPAAAQWQWARARERAEKILEENLWPDRVVDGNDLLAAGLKGKEIGFALDRIEDRLLCGEIITKEEAIRGALQYFERTS